MPLNEKDIQFLEQHIPEMADLAVKQAYWAALASGNSVLVIEDSTIVEVFPDGSRKKIKSLAPPIKIIKGQRIKLNG